MSIIVLFVKNSITVAENELIVPIILASCVSDEEEQHRESSSINSGLDVFRLYPPSILRERGRSRIQELFARLCIALHLPIVESDSRLAELTSLQLVVRGHMADIQVRHDCRDLGRHILVIAHALCQLVSAMGVA
jgi:hypothetical protein